MSNSNLIARIGGLAVTLGIGVGLAVVPGVAPAEPGSPVPLPPPAPVQGTPEFTSSNACWFNDVFPGPDPNIDPASARSQRFYTEAWALGDKKLRECPVHLQAGVINSWNGWTPDQWRNRAVYVKETRAGDTELWNDLLPAVQQNINDHYAPPDQRDNTNFESP